MPYHILYLDLHKTKQERTEDRTDEAISNENIDTGSFSYCYIDHDKFLRLPAVSNNIIKNKSGIVKYSGLLLRNYGSSIFDFVCSCIFCGFWKGTHWTILPYAIYTLPTLVYAYMHYNANCCEEIFTIISPVFINKKINIHFKEMMDLLILVGICFGMAGSIGQSIINLSGGIHQFYSGSKLSDLSLKGGIIFIMIISIAFCVLSGIKKGMNQIARINVILYVCFLALIICYGPVMENLTLIMNNLLGFFKTFIPRAIATEVLCKDPWPKEWTMFYWASWIAWMPTTAVFLGKISYGRTIRQCVGVHLFLNSFVMLIWMTFISGTSIHLQMSHKLALAEEYSLHGPENIPYIVVQYLTQNRASMVLFMVIIFITIITACNSNILVISNLCCKKEAAFDEKHTWNIKLIWAILIPCFAFILVQQIGVEGVKVVANFGGAFSVPIMLLAIISLVRLMIDHKR